MAVEYDDNYNSLCPDGRHKSFESAAMQLAALSSWIDGKTRLIKPPSKVKRELEQLSTSLRKLSLEAQASLWEMGDDGSSYSPSSDMLMRIELALVSISEGRPNNDNVRQYLGTNAVELWWSHGGDIDAIEFIDFLEYLIEESGFSGKDGAKSRIDSVALANQMRKKFENCGPPRFEQSKFFST
jgi:hypothetical protein